MTDLIGGGLCLSALNPKQQYLLRLIRKPDIGRGIDRQSETDDPHEHHDVLMKKPTARPRRCGRGVVGLFTVTIHPVLPRGYSKHHAVHSYVVRLEKTQFSRADHRVHLSS